MAQINKPDTYFNTKLYTGTGSSLAVTGVGFQPDLNWTKDRGATENHTLTDAVRGATKRLFSNTTGAESINVSSLTSFDSDGFTVGGAGTNGGNNQNYVSWNWLGANGTTANTDGTISSTVSANTTSGFSIVSYTGTGSNATVGHGLSTAPKVVITKGRDSSGKKWATGHNSLGWTKELFLNTTDASASAPTAWNNTNPTSSVVSLGTGGNGNSSGETYIMYAFAEKKGYSKFGSYTGNGSTDGTFIYTGFKPAFVMCKRTNSTGVWFMCDNKRVGFNGRPNNTASVGNPELSANDSRSEAGGNTNVMDIFSNGFKLIQSGAEINGSGSSFIYMAFAENPLVGTNNIPATAR